MKFTITIEANKNNSADTKIIKECIQYYNLAKALLPIMSRNNDWKQLIEAIQECKPYCSINTTNSDTHTIYTLAYDDEQETETIIPSDAAANIASLAMEILNNK